VQPGIAMPHFRLPDTAGHVHDSADLVGARGTLVVFLCVHCPYVQHIADALAALADDLTPLGITTVGINSNDTTRYPQDDAAHMRDQAIRHGFRFPYLIDTDQTVARAFDAVCTPDFHLHDAQGGLYYRGQMDDSRPGNDLPVTGADLRAAAQALHRGDAAPLRQRPSIGCGIKWRRTDATPEA
jgi:peroxiredoxin